MPTTPTPTATTTKPPKPGTQPAPRQATKAPMFRMERVQDRQRWLKLLIYGNYGVGKTTLAASAALVPSMRDVVVINAEAGDLPLIDFEEQYGVDIDGIPIQNFKSLGRVHEYLKQHCVARDAGDIERLKVLEASVRGCEPGDIKEPRKFNTVILDSLSEIESFCFEQLLGITDTTRIDDEADGAEWAEYKKNNNMMLRLVRRFRDLPMHVIFTSAERFMQDESKKFKYSPDLTGQLGKKVQGFMDMVGYYAQGRGEQGKIERRLYVMPSATGKFDAKHRYSKFKGEFFTDPTIESILRETGLLDKGGAALT